MLEFENSKLGRPLLNFVQQLQDIKRAVFAFLLCLPTSLLALLLLLLLAYNGFYVFSFHLPFLANSPPDHAPFLPEIHSGESLLNWSTPSLKKISSSVMYVVKEENAPLLFKTHWPDFRKHNFSSTTLSTPKNASSQKQSKKIKKLKRKIRNLSSESQSTTQFSSRIKELFSSSKCNPRFFMTWISSLDSFSEKEMFAVESLFKSHHNACLVIVSKTMDSKRGSEILKPFQEMGFKVMAISPDFDYIFKNTHAEAWFNSLKKGNVNPGEISLGQNLSNLLRLALLYKFGGIYIDTDVLILKSFSNLRNVIGAQTMDLKTGNWSRLNNAVLVFDKNHPLLFKFIEEFALTFDGNKWGHNGPYLVSRVVSRLSGGEEFNLTILPASAFYPVDWSRIQSFFRAPLDELHSKWLVGKLRRVRSQGFAVHLWNRQSKMMEIEKGSIIDQILVDCCIFCNSSSSSSL
ncbi:hypothetical protein UlMin_042256 [Ulmus minor]